MKNPVIKIFVFILALAAGLSGAWFLRLMMFPPILEIGVLTTQSPVSPLPQMAELEPVRSNASKLRPCDEADDFRWDERWHGSGTIAGGVLNLQIKCGVLPYYPQAAKDKNISGLATVNALIDYDGKVIKATAFIGHPLLIDCAIRAAYQTRFLPRAVKELMYGIAATGKPTCCISRRDCCQRFFQGFF